MNNDHWTVIHQFESGHRLFREYPGGRLAIADNSGRTPDLTNDGCLYLDRRRPITALNPGFAVPVLDVNDQEHVVGLRFEDVAWLCRTRGMKIRGRDKAIYVIREAA